jgi:hypothetical protein
MVVRACVAALKNPEKRKTESVGKSKKKEIL